jgi:monooxygenase
MEHFDVVIVGAGISGIGASCHLKMHCPSKRFVVLEGRTDIGGTWDLFQYPGVRSDSDMYTLGYGFKPWTQAKAIADGPAILSYLREVAREYGVDQHMRFGHHVVLANWSSSEARWTVDAVQGEAKTPVRFSCHFLFMGTGYYDYAQGYFPDFPGRENFTGTLVHPQFWTKDIDYADKQVIVIGSGATAVTLVPEIAKRAAHVTMLQRSPSYLITTPAVDPFAAVFKKYLPSRLAFALSRWRNVLQQQLFFKICKYRPQVAKKYLFGKLFKELGPDYDYERHFTPRYNPWEQRLCLVPDSDFFLGLKSGRASIVTDQIDCFTPDGIKLKSGIELKADLIVSATGLKLQGLGGVAVSVDDVAVDLGKKVVYKGMMYNDVPNLAFSFGYSNASWTLRADLTCNYVCRLLNHMDKTGANICVPRWKDPHMVTKAWVDFSSGYFERAKDILPKQGEKAPWTQSQNYALDLLVMKFGKVDDGVMEFTRNTGGISASIAAE